MTPQKFYQQKYAQDQGECDRLNEVLKLAHQIDYEKLLDIGCGDGTFTKLLKKNKAIVYGVDIESVAVEKAKKNGIRAYKNNIDTESLPFKDNYFDVIVAGEIIEHMYDPDRLLDEIHRTLKPSGTAILTTPNLSWWANRLVLMLGYQPYLTEVSLRKNYGKLNATADTVNGHIRNFTLRSMKQILNEHKFNIKKLTTSEVSESMPFFLKPIEKLAKRFPSLGHSIIVTFSKI